MTWKESVAFADKSPFEGPRAKSLISQQMEEVITRSEVRSLSVASVAKDDLI